MITKGSGLVSQPPQWLSLSREMTSARNLLRAGVESVVAIRVLDWDLDPCLTMLSIGVEKTIKLTLGVIGLHKTGTWRVRRGHELVPLNAEMLTQLRQIAEQEKLDGIRYRLDQIEHLPSWPPLLEALHHYGVAGRFTDLDQIAGRPIEYPRPHQLWDEDVEQAILDADPSIWEDVASIPNADRGRQRINDAIAADIRSWHGAVYGSWRIGMLGELAQQFSQSLDIRVPS